MPGVTVNAPARSLLLTLARRRVGHGTGPTAGDRDHVPGTKLRTPPRLNPPVHQHLIGLDELPRMRPVLGETGQLEELPQPDRQLGDRNVLNR